MQPAPGDAAKQPQVEADGAPREDHGLPPLEVSQQKRHCAHADVNELTGVL
jgi:hypothetical protein